METLYLLRFGELTLKSNAVRRRMVEQLSSNLKDAFQRHDIPYQLHRSWARLFLSTTQPEEAESLLKRLFGLSSFSQAAKCPYKDQEDILKFGESFFAEKVKGKTFAVRAKRDKKLPVSTQKINIELGSLLYHKGGSVDLSQPQVTCIIEIREETAYFYEEKLPAPGGLPLGVESKTLTLISGGFDSPVAAWLMMRRGVPQDYLFFELGGDAHRGSIYALLHHLYQYWTYGQRSRLFLIPGKPIIQRLHQDVPQKFWNVMLKRIFYQVGDLIAQKYEHTTLVTGEAVAQVSSQTLSNLRSIEHGVNIPVLTYEKNEIIDLSRKIGTHDISAGVQEYCAITPKRPATRSHPDQVLKYEEQLGGFEFYQELAEQVEIIKVHQVDPDQMLYLKAVTDQIPKNAIWIDLREDLQPPLEHPSVQIPFTDLLAEPEQLEKDKTYLLLCPAGTESAELAFILQEMGYDTYSFQGGIVKLNKQLKRES